MHRDERGLSIGAMVRYADLAKLADPSPFQAIADAAGHVGDRQVRNRGTIGGSLSWNYPAACMPIVALACSAEVECVSAGGNSRTLSMNDFHLGAMTTALCEDEMLTRVIFPRPQPRAGSAYRKWGLVKDALPVVGVAAMIGIKDGGIASAGIAVGGLADGAVRCEAAEAELIGKPVDADTLRAIADVAADSIPTQSDHWTPASYRKTLIRRLTFEVVGLACNRAEIGE